MFKIMCSRSKKGNLYYGLFYDNGSLCRCLNFDVQYISSVFGIPVRDIYLLNEGEYINLEKGV